MYRQFGEQISRAAMTMATNDVVRCNRDAKRAAAFAAFLKDELLENVGHCLWTFTLPKMLRPLFMRHRDLLADLARLAYETIKELMIEAVGNDKARPGVVAVPQSFGNVLNPHPHAHCLATA